RAREGALPAWEAGEVVGSVPELASLLTRPKGFDPGRLARQRELLRDTFAYDEAHPASLRAAEALLELLPAG
ncbi:MAG: hypothetical protein ABIT04_08240, partial [Novosphingobium sp.]